MQKFDLCGKHTSFDDFFKNYDENKGLCCFDGKMPAEEAVPNIENGYACRRCLDILSLGEHLTRQNMIYILRSPDNNGFKTDILGYYIAWQKSSDAVRVWDISLQKEQDASIFNGYARRYINAYVPRFDQDDLSKQEGLYQKLESFEPGMLKTFSHLAVENCVVENGKLQTKAALMCVKGDIDNLGYVLGEGLKNATFATMAGLSRQINNFFAVWLPWLCLSDKRAKNIYTVFAGGDDFYLIGPWLDMVNIVLLLRQKLYQLRL